MTKQIHVVAIFVIVTLCCWSAPQAGSHDGPGITTEQHFLSEGGSSFRLLLVNAGSSAEFVTVDYLSLNGLVRRTDFVPPLTPSEARQFSTDNLPIGTSELVVKTSAAVKVSPASAHLRPMSAQTIITGSPWRSLAGPWATNCNGTFGAIMVAPSDPKTIFIGSSDLANGCGIFKSTDAGVSWSAQNNGIGQVGLFP